MDERCAQGSEKRRQSSKRRHSPRYFPCSSRLSPCLPFVEQSLIDVDIIYLCSIGRHCGLCLLMSIDIRSYIWCTEHHRISYLWLRRLASRVDALSTRPFACARRFDPSANLHSRYSFRRVRKPNDWSTSPLWHIIEWPGFFFVEALDTWNQPVFVELIVLKDPLAEVVVLIHRDTFCCFSKAVVQEHCYYPANLRSGVVVTM